jgi:type IV pilus assembly protein PilO
MKELRHFLTILNLHIAGAVALGGLVFFLGVKVILAFHAAGEVNSQEYQTQQIRAAQLQAQTAHLEGLPQKVDEARDDGEKFFEQRIAPNYSTIVEDLGTESVKNQVRLTRAQYTPKPATDVLTELRVDANLSGDYTALMHFINDLERDKNHVFFIIDGLTFTGQQGGLVNLRLRLTTYLRTNPGEQPPPNQGEQAQAETAKAEVER